jgi:cobalamin-dependent methionine synthase I
LKPTPKKLGEIPETSKSPKANMDGEEHNGDHLAQAKCSTIEVVKSARVMKQSVAWLNPYIEAEKSRAKTKGKILTGDGQR